MAGISFTKHLVLCGVLWWVLAEGTPGSWIVGIPTIVAAAIVSSWLSSSAQARCSPTGLIRFIPYFIRATIHGGLDVARRALSRRMRLNPGLLRYELRIAPGTARVFFVNTVSLLPGTLSADLREDCLWVHVIDASQENYAHLRLLEDRVADLFALGPVTDPKEAL